MKSNGWFARMIDSDLGRFPGRIREVISGFEVFQKNGWGKGFSGRHLTKFIARDESIFTTTWAELRREYFRELILKISPRLGDVKVPLPLNPDGKVLSDKEIRGKVKKGYRLMFCPITEAKQFNGSSLISLGNISCIKDIRSLKYEEDWLSELDNNSRMIDQPYWFWIDCTSKGSTIYSEALANTFPTLIEYLIATFVFEEETLKPLDNDEFIWLRHSCTDKRHLIVGGNPVKRIYRSKIIDSGRAYEGETYGSLQLSNRPMVVRFTEVI